MMKSETVRDFEVFMVVKINNIVFKVGLSNTSEKHIGFISGVRNGINAEALCFAESLAEAKTYQIVWRNKEEDDSRPVHA
jgi:hypothetical protein